MPSQNTSLNAAEVAALLGVSKNTVYAMKNRGELPHFNVGRKLRFRATDIDEYLNRGAGQVFPPQDAGPASPLHLSNFSQTTFNVNGTDIMLDILLSYLVQQDIRLQRSYTNSYDGLVALYRGQIAATTSCLWDGKTGEYNIPYARRLLPGIQAMVIKLASRSRGFIVKRGNPKNLKTWEDLLQPGVRIANRPAGTGARVLLDEHLQLLDANTSILAGYTDIASSNSSLAARVARAHADAVIGTERMVNSADELEFIPLQTEDIDIIIRSDSYDSAPVQALVEVLETGIIRQDIPTIQGYNFNKMGRIVWIG